MFINFIIPSIFGTINPPPGAAAYGGSVFSGLIPFLNNLLKLIFVISGLFGFFNLIIGGFGFLSAGGDPKAIERAWSRIWQSLIGLILIIGSFVLAMIFGYILFGSTQAILYPRIYGPDGSCEAAQCAVDCGRKGNPGGLCTAGQCVCNPKIPGSS